jgi:hypothetical protein
MADSAAPVLCSTLFTFSGVPVLDMDPTWLYPVFRRLNWFILYRVIHKSLWDFWPLRYSRREGHAQAEHANRGTDTPSFCPTLQVLDMSTLGDAADFNPVIRFLPHTINHVVYGARTYPLCHVIYHSCEKGSWRQSLLWTIRCCNVCGRNLITGLTSASSPKVDISSTCKVGQQLGVSVPLLTCSPSAWPSRLLYRRGRKSRRDLWITLYNLANYQVQKKAQQFFTETFCKTIYL